MRNIDLELLRTLVAFDELGSLAKAADRVGRSESAVSLQLKRLDQLFRKPLFVRTGRRLTLTDEGNWVLHHARRILAMNDAVTRRINRSSLSARIKIGASEEFGETALTQMIRETVQNYPDVRIELQVDSAPEVLVRLERAEIDVALTIGLPDNPSGRRLQRTRLIWIAAPDFEHVADRPIPLVFREGPCRFKQYAIDALDSAGIPWEVAFKASNLTSIWPAVHAGVGITLGTAFWVPMGLFGHFSNEAPLPAIAEFDVMIHYNEAGLSPEIREIAHYIQRSVPIHERTDPVTGALVPAHEDD